ncbi:MAG: DNA polymerase III subunit gamma/tau [Bacteroidales bacterium]|nr:DNA polymerase III subunit gamma/tau [Bacteroidales bacterium]MDD4030300.1 DNA polymerase III subunit gamma/tau [Bacteroidales bacterium]MDD4436294.1 DNA polymerase III subunit gamma/tau [Bacteroidales bacterium]MDD5732253.1 DNA polymerase III subunit gamma/tau [Bacteroidales bacterium]
MDHFVVSARKYRPQQFNDVVDQDNIVTTLKNAIQRKQLAHAYLFCGPRGVGKTTCARIFARTINCLNPSSAMEACGTCESCVSFAQGRSYSIHELDAASNNSVDDIRELIDKVRIPPQVGKYSVYIIDEVHMLSQSAFNAFLKTLEEPPSYALFIMATTEKHKVLPTILSRCQVFDFNRITIKAMTHYLAEVAGKEGVTIGQDSLHVIARKADGAMRDALTLLDQCIAVSGKEVTYQQVISNLNVLDSEYYFRLTDMALEGRFDSMLLLFDEVLTRGFNALHFISGLSSHFRNLLVSKQPESLPLLDYGQETARRYKEQAAACPLPFLFAALGICTQAEAGYKQSNQPRLHIEMALVRLSRIESREIAKNPATDKVPATRKAESIPASDSASASAPASAPASAAASAPLSATPSAAVSAPSSATSSDTASASASKTVRPPAAEPAAAPTATASIKKLMHQNQKEKQREQEPSGETGGDRELTMERLEKALPGLMNLFKDKPNLSATLSRCPPRIVDKCRVQFTVVNELQKTWIEEHYGRIIDNYLRHILHNKQVCVSLMVEDAPESTPGNSCYMPEEKAKFMAENNPEVAALRDDLNLDIS